MYSNLLHGLALCGGGKVASLLWARPRRKTLEVNASCVGLQFGCGPGQGVAKSMGKDS